MDPTATLDDLREAVTTFEERWQLARVRLLDVGVPPAHSCIERNHARAAHAAPRPSKAATSLPSAAGGVSAMTAGSQYRTLRSAGRGFVRKVERQILLATIASALGA